MNTFGCNGRHTIPPDQLPHRQRQFATASEDLVPKAPAHSNTLPPATDQWQDRALCGATDPSVLEGGSTREARRFAWAARCGWRCHRYAPGS